MLCLVIERTLRDEAGSGTIVEDGRCLAVINAGRGDPVTICLKRIVERVNRGHLIGTRRCGLVVDDKDDVFHTSIVFETRPMSTSAKQMPAFVQTAEKTYDFCKRLQIVIKLSVLTPKLDVVLLQTPPQLGVVVSGKEIFV